MGTHGLGRTGRNLNPSEDQIVRFRGRFTCDPWLPRESHQDPLTPGHAVCEAVLFLDLPRVRTDPAVLYLSSAAQSLFVATTSRTAADAS